MNKLRPSENAQIGNQDQESQHYFGNFHVEQRFQYTSTPPNVVFKQAPIFHYYFGSNMPQNSLNYSLFPNILGNICTINDPHYQNLNFHVRSGTFIDYQPTYYDHNNAMTITNPPTNQSLVSNKARYSSSHHRQPQNTNSQVLKNSKKQIVHEIQDDYSLVQKNMLKIERNLARKSNIKEEKRNLKIINETKNVAKNYGKTIINFILSHLDWIQSQFGIQNRQQLISELNRQKARINAISHLKQMWQQSKFAKQFRILSNIFLRKYAFTYIFNSRVSNHSIHIKYKSRLQSDIRRR